MFRKSIALAAAFFLTVTLKSCMLVDLPAEVKKAEIVSISDCIYEEVGNFSEGLLALKKDGKWGYVDETGKAVIDFRFDKAADFSKGIAVVTENKLEGIISRDGKYIVKPKYGEIDVAGDKLAVVYTHEGVVQGAKNKCGVVSLSTGKEILSMKDYNKITVTDNLIIAEKIHDSADETPDVSLHDVNGKTIVGAGKYKSIEPFSAGYALVESTSKDYLKDSKAGRKNFIDKKGKLLSDNWYVEAGSFRDGRAIVCENKWIREDGTRLSRNDKWSVIDKKGKKLYCLAEPEKSGYTYKATIFSKSAIAIPKAEDTKNCYFTYLSDSTKKLMGYGPFSEIQNSTNGICIIKNPEDFCNGGESNCYGLFNADTNRQVAVCEYNRIFDVGANRFCVQKDEKFGIISDKGVMILPVKYDTYDDFETMKFSEGLLALKDGNGEGLVIDEDGKIIAKGLGVSKIRPYSGGFAAFSDDNSWALMDRYGRQIDDKWFEAVTDCKDGIFCVKENGRWGIRKIAVENEESKWTRPAKACI